MSEVPGQVRATKRLPQPLIAVVLWEKQPEKVFATVGVSVHTLNRWSQKEGLTKHTRGTGTGSRDYWLLHEVLAFLAATSKTNQPSAADSGE